MSESGFLHLGTSQAVCGQAVSPGQAFQECTLARLAVGIRLCLLGHSDECGTILGVLTRSAESLQFFVVVVVFACLLNCMGVIVEKHLVRLSF